MARDYKHRAQHSGYRNRRPVSRKPNMLWRWLVVVVLVVAFVVFLNMISNMARELIAGKPIIENRPGGDVVRQNLAIDVNRPVTTQENPGKSQEIQQIQSAAPEEPSYDFYTILPQAEVVVPDHEIKTRVREELIGKGKAAKYVMQAGSFREAIEADSQKARLAQLGIEARVETAKVGNVIWHRVKIGPYDNSSSVATIKDLLQKHGFAVIVTEVDR